MSKMNVGDVCRRLSSGGHNIVVSSELIIALGVPALPKEQGLKRGVYFEESQYPEICRRLGNHFEAMASVTKTPPKPVREAKQHTVPATTPGSSVDIDYEFKTDQEEDDDPL